LNGRKESAWAPCLAVALAHVVLPGLGCGGGTNGEDQCRGGGSEGLGSPVSRRTDPDPISESKCDYEALVGRLSWNDRDSRWDAAKALVRLDDPRAIWALVKLLSETNERGVVEPATWALLRLSPDPLEESMLALLQERLMRTTPAADASGPPWGRRTSWVSLVTQTGDLSMHMDLTAFASGPPEGKAKALRGVPVIQALCRGVLAMRPTEPIAICFSPRVMVSPLDEAIASYRWQRGVQRVSNARDRRAQETAEGREAHRTLRQSGSFEPFDGTLSDLITFFRERAGLKVRVDWPAIKKQGARESSSVRLTESVGPRMRLSSVFPRAVLNNDRVVCMLNYMILRDGTVLITTHAGVRRRLGLETKESSKRGRQGPGSGEKRQ